MMMTKPLYFSAIFFLLLAVSHASRFDLNLINLNHREEDNLVKSTSSSSSNGGEDPLIRLPTETSPVPDLTQSSDNTNKQPQLKTTSSPLDRLVDVDLDLTQLMNRRPVHLRNRFRFPLIRYIPRRCRHLHRFSGLSAVDFREEVAEIIRHRHVARKFPEGDSLDAQFVSFIPVNNYHGHHDHHDGEVDRTVEMKREDEKYEVKEEYDGEWKGDHHHRHHHHHHHYEHHHEEEEHEKNKEKNKDDIFHKIRKFLTHF